MPLTSKYNAVYKLESMQLFFCPFLYEFQTNIVKVKGFRFIDKMLHCLLRDNFDVNMAIVDRSG